MDNILLNALNTYYDTLEIQGYMNPQETQRLIVLLFLQGILELDSNVISYSERECIKDTIKQISKHICFIGCLPIDLC